MKFEQLLYRETPICTVRDAFCDDGIWFAKVELCADAVDRDTLRLALEYVAACQEWNDRTRSNTDAPPDPSELDAYAALTRSGKWVARTGDGRLVAIEDAPVFFSGNEVSWRTRREP